MRNASLRIFADCKREVTMADNRKKRIRELQAELGCSYRTACNEYERRKRAHAAGEEGS